MGVFVSLQGLHDGELRVVFEPPGLLAENLPQHPQSQSSDHMLGGLHNLTSNIACPICSVLPQKCVLRVCLPLCHPLFRAAAAGWSWNVHPTPAACFRESASAVRTALPSSPQCARCDWTTLLTARPPALTGQGCYLLGDNRKKNTVTTWFVLWWHCVYYSVRMCLCTVSKMLWVVHAGVFASVFEGRVER